MLKNQWTEKLEELEKEKVDLENEIELLESEAREYQSEIKDLKNKIDYMQESAYGIYKYGEGEKNNE